MITYRDTLNDLWAKHLAPRAADAPTVISTFAGCGGSSLGYSAAGFREVLAVEWDDNAVQTFGLNFPEVPVFHGDIAKLSVDEALARAGLRPGELDVLDGSPPCQGFSMAGKRDFGDDRNLLFREYVRLLRGLRPRCFVMENVASMASGKMALIFRDVLTELKACGYRVVARVLNAMYFGVPQSRERMIFVGVRADLPVEPSHPQPISLPITASTAIRDVVNDPAEVAMLLAAGQKYAAYHEWPRIPIGKTMADLGYSKGQSARKYNPHRPANTTTKTDGYLTMYGAMHWAEWRRFTVAEFKRFCSFPDQFQFAGGWGVAVNRLGNAVMPLFMKAIALNVRNNILTPAKTRGEAA